MVVTDADEADIIRRLGRDVEATLGTGYEAEIRRHAARLRNAFNNPARHPSLVVDWYPESVVEYVQQDFHDFFIHTTWPPCPRHLRHPLWLHGDRWMCEQDGVTVAQLGELGDVLQSLRSAQRGSSDNAG